jgi:D-glycero-alpha-D-manno-heptose-7-phosphate kinase
LGKPIGRQDHYAAALGGFNFMEFLPGGGVRTEPLVCPPGTLRRLHSSMLLFFTGKQRSAPSVLTAQRAAILDGRAVEPLVALRDLAYELRDALTSGEDLQVGDIMHRGWELKRSLAEGISNAEVDRLYAAARANGVSGGKLLGAGGGGFLLILAPVNIMRASAKS